ncbi:MAG: flagellar hook-basal body complex protein FliE [Aquificae bacterium]|nr:flagellar hook-basal body complex protein FliE [Aquificota bacterium]
MEVGRIDYGFPIGERPEDKRRDLVESFKDFVRWVNERQLESDALKEKVLLGEDVPLHEIVIASEKASVALNLLIEVRNKLLEAYNELMRMQL